MIIFNKISLKNTQIHQSVDLSFISYLIDKFLHIEGFFACQCAFAVPQNRIWQEGKLQHGASVLQNKVDFVNNSRIKDKIKLKEYE